MSQFIYAWPDDNVAPLATVTPSAVDSSYPGTNLTDSDTGIPSKLTTTTGSFLIDHGSAVRVDLVAIFQHNLDAGLANAAVMRNASNAWGSPSMNVPITIPAYRADGYPVSPWVDLRSKTGYNGATGYRYTLLNFGTANSHLISIGELVLIGTYRQLPFGIRWGSTRRSRRGTVSYKTDGGNIGYDLGVRVRGLSVTIDIKDAPGSLTNQTAIENWLDSLKGDLRPCLIVPDDTVNDAWLVKNTTPEYEFTRESTLKQLFQLKFEEAGRGVPA